MALKMKGFMHVVEIIIIVLLLFFLIYQFSALPNKNAGWAEIKTKILSGDMALSLKRININWLDKEEIERRLFNIIPDTIIYSVSLTNINKPFIKVGCYADENYCIELSNVLSNFSINGITTSFRVDYVDDKNKLFSLDYDVYIIKKYEPDIYKTETLYFDAMRSYLSEDRGIIEMFYMNDERLDNIVQKNIFGLNISNDIDNGEPVIINHDFSMTNSHFMEINMLYHTPMFYDDFNDKNKWLEHFTTTGIFKIKKNAGIEGNDSYLLTTCDRKNYIIANGIIFSNATVKLYLKLDRPNSNFDLFLRNTTSEAYMTRINTSGVFFYKANMVTGDITLIDKLYNPLNIGIWYPIIVDMKGSIINIYLNTLTGNNIILSVNDDSIQTGGILIESCGDEGVEMDNFRVHLNKYSYFGNLINKQNVTSVNGNEYILLKQIGTDLAGCVINDKIVNGAGRTAWLSGSIDLKKNESAAFIKFLVAWAAGYGHKVIKNDIINPVTTRIHIIKNIDMYQPIEIEIQAGNAYQ